MGYEGLGNISVLSNISLPAGAQKYATDIEKKAYQYFYSEAQKYWDKINKDPTVAKIRKVGDALAEVGYSAKAFVQHFQKAGGEIDASGIADAAMLAQKGISSILAFAGTVGADPSIASQIKTWTTTSTGCVAGVAAGFAGGGPMGAAAGGVACALSVISNFFQLIQAPKVTPLIIAPPGTNLAVFVPNAQQQVFIVTDAARLAALLKSYCGFGSYAHMYSLLFNSFKGLPRPEESDYIARGYPPHPPKLAGGGYGTPTKPIPAIDMQHILTMFERGGNTLFKALRVIAKVRKKNEEAAISSSAISDRPLHPERYWYDHDINAEAVLAGARIAREAIVSKISPGTIHAESKYLGWKDYTYQVTDYRPFLQVAELLSFFAAATIKEERDGLDPFDAFVGTYLPIRWYWVDDFVRSGKVGGKYSESCWTNLARTVGPCSNLANRTNNMRAALEVAHIRLLAAFSYIHMIYKWTGRDMIAEADVASVFRRPVDPRTAVPATGKFIPQKVMGTSATSTEPWKLTNVSFDGGITLLAMIQQWENTVGKAAQDARMDAEKSGQVVEAAFLQARKETTVMSRQIGLKTEPITEAIRAARVTVQPTKPSIVPIVVGAGIAILAAKYLL